jgi:hypothetical protein
MGKNQNTWSHRTQIIFHEIKIIFHPLGSLAGFPARAIVFWEENVRGTRNASLVFKCLRQQYFTCMCFLRFIWYNKTFLACGLRKYENVFTNEYHIPLGRCPQGIWYYWVNTCSYFPHQHALNVYYYTSYNNYHK